MRESGSLPVPSRNLMPRQADQGDKALLLLSDLREQCSVLILILPSPPDIIELCRHRHRRRQRRYRLWLCCLRARKLDRWNVFRESNNYQISPCHSVHLPSLEDGPHTLIMTRTTGGTARIFLNYTPSLRRRRRMRII
jgi:hypothetical protein